MIVAAGQVLLDNVDIKTLQLKWLRDQIGLVNQEPALFATTILENILYGKPDATIAEVEATTTSANAHIHYYRIANHSHHFHRQFAPNRR